jgi:predicted N-acetyltransferase YhbS
MQSSRVSLERPDLPVNPIQDNITLRPGGPDDAPACGKICYEAFKAISEDHNFPPDFPSAEAAVGMMNAILSSWRVYSVVVESEGRIVGSNFLWEDTIGGIGPITVDPAVQNGSIGRRLMQDALDYSRRRGFAGVRLVQAAFHNRSLSLYTKLGFVVREPLALIQGPAIKEQAPDYDVRPAGEQDIEACNAFCREVHGHAREKEVLEAVQQGTATMVIRNNRLAGYATQIGFFGHAVAETNEDLKALIAAAPAFAGPGFLLPIRNADLFRWCLEKKLRVIQPMTLMSTGLYSEPAGAFLPSILY